MRSESQNIEYKASWNDKYLQWVCGFANAQGGRIYIGVDDERNIIGVKDAKRLMEDIPNKVVAHLGIVVEVNLLTDEGKEYIEIVVKPSELPVAYKGVYHYRSGSTKQELKGMALQQFVLKKMGREWDDIPIEHATLDDIDRKAIDYFLRCGINAQRIAGDEWKSPTEEVLKNLGMITGDGKLKTAAILLFGKHIRQFFPGADFKIGRFHTSESELITQDLIECNIMQMASKVMEALRSKYLVSPIHYDGMQRIEELEIPEKALREIIYNSIAHKDYTGPSIQMRIYDDRLELWNFGLLPAQLSPESLMRQHASYPRNKNVAYAFFKAGFIEAWGRGYKKIREEFEDQDYPLPVVSEVDGGVNVWIKRFSLRELMARNGKRYGKNATHTGINDTNVVDDDVDVSLSKLSERQRRICQMIKEDPYVTIQKMSLALSVTKRTVDRDLAAMKGIVKHEGTDNAGKWILLK